MLNNNIADGGSIRTLVVWCVAGIEAVMFIAELVLWGIRCGVANQTCGWKQNQERLISRYLSLLTRGDPLQKWQEGYFLHLCLCALCSEQRSEITTDNDTAIKSVLQLPPSSAPARSSFDCRAPPAPPSHHPQTPALQSWRKQIAATMFSVKLYITGNAGLPEADYGQCINSWCW